MGPGKTAENGKITGMIEVDKKNRWAIDLALHIPIPSIKIRITGVEDGKIENTPLQFSKTKIMQAQETQTAGKPDADALTGQETKQEKEENNGSQD